MQEEWRDVVGWEGMYQISSIGRVRSVDRVQMHYSNTDRPYYKTYKGRILSQGNCSKYFQVILVKDNKAYNKLVHRLVAEAFILNPDNLPEVNHKDEDPSNNNVDNLEWCTKSYNINYGKRNELVSNALKGRPKSKESIDKMRESLKGNIPWNKGRHTRPIICLDANICFDCCEDAAEWIGGVTPEAVRYALNKIACCKGHVFVYADSVPEDTEAHIKQCLEHYRKGAKAGRPCRCIEDNKVFKTTSEAARFYNISNESMSYRMEHNVGVKLPDGRIVHFEKASYDELTNR